MADTEKKQQGGKCKKSKSGARKANVAKAGRRRPAHIKASVNSYGERVYAAADRPAKAPQTTPQARKRARWLSSLFAAKAPAYARLEAVKDARGNWITQELPPLARATHREFFKDEKPWMREYGH